MRVKLTLLFTLCFLVFAVFCLLWHESKASVHPSDIDSATGEALRRSHKLVAAEKYRRRSIRLPDLAKQKLASRETSYHFSDSFDDDSTTEEQAAVLNEEAFLAAEKNSSERIIELRKDWMGERFDEDWTERMTDRVYDKVDSLLENDVDISAISCQESICRMYLEFANQGDFDTFKSTKFDPLLEYNFQPMPPHEVADENPEQDKYIYEILVKKRGGVALSSEPPMP